jgi:virginiamycin A acetyltransferase
MVSLRVVLYNLLQMRKVPKCSVNIGRGTTSVPYIITSNTSDIVKIGNYCSIGHGVILVTHPGHIPPKGMEEYRVATYPVSCVLNHGFDDKYYLHDSRNFVIIGNDVTLGANVIVLPGVKISDGAIVGAGAVVTSDIPPFAVAAGVPAKVLKYRYPEEQIKKLMQISWWNWSEKKIYDNMDYFYGKVTFFIEKFYPEYKK